MQAMVGKAPKLANNDLKQQAAEPLGQFLRFDPWTDQVIQMHSSYEPLLSARDKMPFEITPVYMKLGYWQPPAPPVAAPAPAAPATGADNSAAPATAQPTDATGTAAPAGPGPAENAPAATTPPPPASNLTQPATGTSNPPQR
jgi:hypothetical protein